MPNSTLPVDFLFRLDAAVGEPPPVPVPNGPYGTRLIVTASGGKFEGPRLRGRIVPGPGSEWATLCQDGSLRADVRLLLETDDGAAILMTYLGVGRLDAEQGGWIRTAPLFQTGDERYAWLNEIQAVGIGEPSGSGVVYDVYALK